MSIYYCLAKAKPEAYYYKIMNDITCPNCGKIVHVDEVLRHQLEKTILKEESVKQKIELEKAKLEAEKEAEIKFKERSETQLRQINKQNKVLEEKLIKEQKDREEFEKKAELKATKEASQVTRLEKLEYEKKIRDMQKALEDAQRKAKQGSQQLQGEVLELELEERLKEAFPLDEFLPVPKGIEGADIWQKVKNKFGQEAGSILWETKRTKQWSNSWLSKLREDARQANATVSILVSEVLPDDTKYFKRKEGVIITSYEYAIGITDMVRERLLHVAVAKSRASNDEKLQEVYEYISSDAFRHKFESHFESVNELRKGLTAEKRAMERIWKHRESQIERLDRSASQMFGEFQGVIPSLKPIKNLQLGTGDDESDQETLI